MCTFTQEEQNYLLAVAREAITEALEECASGDAGCQRPAPEGSALAQCLGVFVTLHKGKALRGCIGRMSAAEPLTATVRTMAREAAFRDPRFPPLTLEELARCSLEISVLSPFKLCADPDSVVVGLHGLYLVHQGRSGVLLPQVPLEQGWDRTAYLDYLCIKASLPPHSYRAPGAKLYTFTAVVFSEPPGAVA
ncbi:MAG: AmmeMemoRadiSam system protein A [Spirochaetaceae bacterium]|jgi:AmmeMemoRadiSam system protein A|nr:AmmeMemoRadiSam system protein A [Spirochaetaceae bacterium]